MYILLYSISFLTAKLCSSLHPPSHGSLLMPCIERFGFSCFTKCSNGYYLVGSSENKCKMSNGKTSWQPNNASCEGKFLQSCTFNAVDLTFQKGINFMLTFSASTPCVPNPCQHSGRCIKEEIKYVCDCAGTNYTGPKCNTGIINIAAMPQLTVNKRSSPIHVEAHPDDYIQITPYTSEDASFQPSTVYINKSSTQSFFTVKAAKVGKLTITYKVNGTNSASFQRPEATVAYAAESIIPIEAVDITMSYFNIGCHDKFIRPTCITNISVNFKSSCSWYAGSNGLISVKSKFHHIPLSMFGISTDAFESVHYGGIVDPKANIEAFLTTRVIPSPCLSCGSNNMTTNIANYIVNNNYFQRYILKVISDIFPFWFTIEPGAGSLASVENLKAVYGTGAAVKKLMKSCSMLPLHESNAYVVYQPRLPLILQFLSVRKNVARSREQFCIAIDVCEPKLHLSFPTSTLLDISPEFKALGLHNMRVKVSGISHMNKASCLLLPKIPGKCVKADFVWRMKGDFQSTSCLLRLDGSFFANHEHPKKVNIF